MAFFENLKEKVSETTKAVGDKTKQVSEITKLSYKISTEERDAEHLYTELGKACYAALKNDSESEFFGSCEEISAKLDQIEELKAELHSLKGVTICEKCGAEVASDNEFCGKCGAKVVRPVSEPETVETTAETTTENDTDTKE